MCTKYIYIYFDMSTQGRKIRTSNLHFMKDDLQFIELLFDDVQVDIYIYSCNKHFLKLN
jgi:hypothetical protein